MTKLSRNQKWAAAVIPMWAAVALLGLVLAMTSTRLDFGGGTGYSCGRRIDVFVQDGYGGAFDTACQGQARAELMRVPLLAVLCPVLLGGAFVLTRWAERDSAAKAARDRDAKGPPPPGVPPSHLHWDGHRWLRWDGSAWIPDSEYGSF